MKTTQVLHFSFQQSSSMQVNNCGLEASITGFEEGMSFRLLILQIQDQ